MNYIAIIIGVIVIGAIGWFSVSGTPRPGVSSPETGSSVTTREGGATQPVVSPSDAASTASPDTTASTGSGATPAPDFHLQNYDGEAVSLANFKGKPMVINSWAAWCPFCRKELPDFATVQKEFGDKVAIIAIDRQESLKTAKNYTDKQGTTDGLTLLLDPSDSFYRAIGGFSMPETIFVDKNGAIVFHKRGPMDVNEIRDRVKALIE